MKRARPCVSLGAKTSRSGRAGFTDPGREDGFVVELFLYPVHEVVDVFGRRDFCRSLERDAVLPVILEPGAGRHDGTFLARAELGHAAVLFDFRSSLRTVLCATRERAAR